MAQDLPDYLITDCDDIVIMHSLEEKEFLELAAKAAGVFGEYVGIGDYPDWLSQHDGCGIYQSDGRKWNPLTSDADAFNLACKLNFEVYFLSGEIDTGEGIIRFDDIDAIDNDHPAIMRMMIVIAAALMHEYDGYLIEHTPYTVCKTEISDLVNNYGSASI
jgi:hypothetical protein